MKIIIIYNLRLNYFFNLYIMHLILQHFIVKFWEIILIILWLLNILFYFFRENWLKLSFLCLRYTFNILFLFEILKHQFSNLSSYFLICLQLNLKISLFFWLILFFLRIINWFYLIQRTAISIWKIEGKKFCICFYQLLF